MARAVEVVRVVEMVRLVEVIRVVEVVYRHEENLRVKGPNKDVGLPMTMPQAAGKNWNGSILSTRKDHIFLPTASLFYIWKFQTDHHHA